VWDSSSRNDRFHGQETAAATAVAADADAALKHLISRGGGSFSRDIFFHVESLGCYYTPKLAATRKCRPAQA